MLQTQTVHREALPAESGVNLCSPAGAVPVPGRPRRPETAVRDSGVGRGGGVREEQTQLQNSFQKWYNFCRFCTSCKVWMKSSHCSEPGPGRQGANGFPGEELDVEPPRRPRDPGHRGGTRQCLKVKTLEKEHLSIRKLHYRKAISYKNIQ